MKFLQAAFFAMLLSCASGAALAENVYAVSTPGNTIKALLRGGALAADDRRVLRDYARLNECQVIANNSQDDFKMAKIETAIAKIVDEQRGAWPDAYLVDTPMTLDKYDFAGGQFKLGKESQLQNVNSFSLGYEIMSNCQGAGPLEVMPTAVSVRIDQPVTLLGIPLSRDAGNTLLQRMLQAGNTKRQIYARFRIGTSYMVPIVTQTENPLAPDVRKPYAFDGVLQSIEFYEDEGMTKPIWTFKR